MLERKSNERRSFPRRDFKKDEFDTHLVSLKAVSLTRAGGRIRSFSVLVVAGNGKGLVGCGVGKSKDLVEAIQKAERYSKKNVIKVALDKTTIVHNVRSSFCGIKIVMNRARPGTGLKAGGVARHVLRLAGIEDISCKCIGNSMSPYNVVYAVLNALQETSSIQDIAKRLNKDVKEILERSRV